jgi:hypothetical protein
VSSTSLLERLTDIAGVVVHREDENRSGRCGLLDLAGDLYIEVLDDLRTG